MDPFKAKGFTKTKIEKPFPVTLFPDPNFSPFRPTPGVAVGIERCNQFGSCRLIVKYDTPPRRRSSDEECYWPNGVVYVVARDVEGFTDQRISELEEKGAKIHA